MAYLLVQNEALDTTTFVSLSIFALFPILSSNTPKRRECGGGEVGGKREK